MSLFAYTGDEDDNHFAQAFSQSRLLKWQGAKEPKGDHQVDPSTISNDLASKKIWEMQTNAPKLDFHPRAPPKLCLHIRSVNFTGYGH